MINIKFIGINIEALHNRYNIHRKDIEEILRKISV